jgi:hypothetical protein
LDPSDARTFIQGYSKSGKPVALQVAVVAEASFSKLNTSSAQWQVLFVHVSPNGQPQSWQQFDEVSEPLQIPSPQRGFAVHLLLVHVKPEPQPQSWQQFDEVSEPLQVPSPQPGFGTQALLMHSLPDPQPQSSQHVVAASDPLQVPSPQRAVLVPMPPDAALPPEAPLLPELPPAPLLPDVPLVPEVPPVPVERASCPRSTPPSSWLAEAPPPHAPRVASIITQTACREYPKFI